MRKFEDTFPELVSSCGQIHDALMPAALVLLVLSFAFLCWSGPPAPQELVRHLIKLFLLVLLITHTDTLINSGQEIMERFVQAHVPARPENVAQRFKERLADAQNSAGVKDQGWWDMLFSSNVFEAIIYAVLVLISWLAIALQFYISLLQKVLLLLCWVLSPVLFACFAAPPVSGLAFRHLLRIVGLLAWPLGLALASTITDGLLGLQTDQAFWSGGGGTGKVAYVLINLLAVATIALWILFSTVLAPAVMQRLFAGGPGGASHISRTADLLVNTGIPMAAGITPFIGRVREFFSRKRRDDAPPPPPLIHVEPPPTAPIDAPTLPPLSADDPTAENAVSQYLEEDAGYRDL
jgi:hypothetical protein